MTIKNFTSILEVPADIDFAVAVRGYTFIVIQEYIGAGRKIAYRIQQVIDELFINAVRYGSAVTEKVTLTYVLENGILSIEVADTGTGAQKVTAKELEGLIAQRREFYQNLKKQNKINQALGGRGLPEIVYSWMDSIDLKDNDRGGISITAVKNIYNEIS
jgi:anti-sigma regulatory factor (Ser/Thr protein kinase)